MRRSSLEPTIGELPGIIPVFPLNGAVLLPGGRLPLNIFEHRYLNLVRDTLATRQRVFGMIQAPPAASSPASASSQNAKNGRRLYRVGCLGRLISFEETSDGRFLIALDGLIRFSVTCEAAMKGGYRRLAVDYGEFAHDLDLTDEKIDRPRLLAALRVFFAIKGFTADWDSISQCSDEKLITTLAMICPFGVEDKQALLEARTIAQRCEILATVLEIENSAPHHAPHHNEGREEAHHVRH